VSKPKDIYLDMDDLRIIIFSAFYAFARELAPEARGRVLTLLRAIADSPARTPEAAEGLRGLVRFIEGGDEPKEEPKLRFKIIDGGVG
jgi:hypothetical protein